MLAQNTALGGTSPEVGECFHPVKQSSIPSHMSDTTVEEKDQISLHQ